MRAARRPIAVAELAALRRRVVREVRMRVLGAAIDADWRASLADTLERLERQQETNASRASARSTST